MSKSYVVKLRKQRAFDKGSLARSLGMARESCPYKESFYSLRPLWLSGYDQQVELERIGKAVPHPSTHLTQRAADTLPRCEISRECYFGQDGGCLRGGECR